MTIYIAALGTPTENIEQKKDGWQILCRKAPATSSGQLSLTWYAPQSNNLSANYNTVFEADGLTPSRRVNVIIMGKEWQEAYPTETRAIMAAAEKKGVSIILKTRSGPISSDDIDSACEIFAPKPPDLQAEVQANSSWSSYLFKSVTTPMLSTSPSSSPRSVINTSPSDALNLMYRFLRQTSSPTDK